jgi:hypothetical protein
MELVVRQMNKDGTWDITNTTLKSSSGSDDAVELPVGGDDEIEERTELTVDDVLAVVEEMTMLH